MTPEWLDETGDRMGAHGPAAEDLAPLRECVRRAFALAKAGASSRGYRLLRQGREHARTRYAPSDPRGRELLYYWDAVLRWYEQYAPPPL